MKCANLDTIDFGENIMKLLFDCDDTLYDCSWPFRKCVQELLPQAKEVNLDNFYRDYRACGDLTFPLIQAGKLSVDENGEIRIKMACEMYNIEISDDIAHLFQQMYKYFQYHIQMDKELKNYLIHSQIECGIVSNGEDTHQRRKIKSLYVTDFMREDHIFTSGQLGVDKPDPKIFELVFNQLNDEPSNWYYVGDNYINDMECAKKAGMKTIHFNRHHQKEGVASDYVVYTEAQLIDLLKELNN